MKKLFLLLTIIFCLHSCSDVEQSTPAVLTVMLEDAPADYAKITIKIDKISIFNGTQWYDLNNVKFPIDILRYTGGESLPVVTENIPNGEYSKIRFRFATDGNNVTIGKEEHKLTITEQNREVEMDIKLNFGATNEYLICDIDMAASIIENGWGFKPQMAMIDINEAGAISGVIATAEGKGIAQRMYVEVKSSTGVTKATYTNIDNGKFFIRLYEGVYTISIIPINGSEYDKTNLENVEVRKHEATKLGAIVMSKVIKK